MDLLFQAVDNCYKQPTGNSLELSLNEYDNELLHLFIYLFWLEIASGTINKNILW